MPVQGSPGSQQSGGSSLQGNVGTPYSGGAATPAPPTLTPTIKVIAKVIAGIKKKDAGDIEREEQRGITTRDYVTNAQVTSNQDNYNTGGLDAVRVSSDAPRNITGFTGGRRGLYKLIVNTGTSTITIKHLDANSDADNRVYGPGASDISLTAGAAVQLWYDDVDLVWRKII